MKNHSETPRIALALLIGFSIPISTSFTNLLCLIAFCFIVLEGQFQTLRHNPIAVSALLLFGIMLLGIFYTPVSFSEAGLMLDKYREFLFIPIFILIFRDSTTRQLGYYAFLSAMGLTLFLSYLMALTGWEIGKGTPENPFIFKDYIIQGILMALAAYFIAVQSWFSPRWKWLGGILVLLIVYNILFLSIGRTGYLVLFCLILLFFYQIYHLRGLLLGGIVLALFTILVYTHSDMLQQRFNKVFADIQAYQDGKINLSVGERLEWYENSLTLVAKHPVLGSGTGSFSVQYKQLAESQDINTTVNPHNEYLMIGVQWGLVGVGLFLYLFYILWHTGKHLKMQSWFMVQGLVVTMLVGCLFNSLWLDNTGGHIFAYLIAVFYGGFKIEEPQLLFSK